MSTWTPDRPLAVALLGAGSVGAQTARQLIERQDDLSQRIGQPYRLIGVAVRSLDAPRSARVPAELLTTDAEALIDRADIVIELIGGIEPARTYVERALRAGKDVVTANKALLAAHQVELFETGRAGGAETYYEAAAAAAIPIIRPLQDSLVGDRIDKVIGIVNGSTNYILDRIDSTGMSMGDALAEAQRLGYAEADPSADVDGHDAAAKATLLAGLAFHTHVTPQQVSIEGIRGITAELIAQARADGYSVKLVAIAERLNPQSDDEAINVRVYPALLPLDHPLSAVRGAKNAIFIHALDAGDLMFYGAGAGGVETSSTVLSDFVLSARRIVRGAPPEFTTFEANLPVVSLDRVRTRYQITLVVADAPGVLAQIAGVFARHGVSVAALTQRQDADGPADARLVVVTHAAMEADLRATVEDLAAGSAGVSVAGVIRVEGA